MPIINNLNKVKDRLEMELGISEEDEQVEKINRGYFRFNMDTEDLMFQNANDLFYQEKRKKKLSGFISSSQAAQQRSEMKGALVITHSKELINQIYIQARKLDTKNRFLLNRATSSLQMKSPIVEFITPDLKKGDREYSDDELFNISLTNVINNASWQLSDVLFSTPVVMSHILESK